jgi:hypothetical protein
MLMPVRRPLGRPTKFTPDRQAVILAATEIGATRRLAARAAGVSPKTLGLWLRFGEEVPGGPHSVFVDAMRMAEAQGRMKLLRNINRAACHDWYASAWLLERIDPDRWCLKRRIEVLKAKREAISRRDGEFEAAVRRELLRDPEAREALDMTARKAHAIRERLSHGDSTVVPSAAASASDTACAAATRGRSGLSPSRQDGHDNERQVHEGRDQQECRESAEPILPKSGPCDDEGEDASESTAPEQLHEEPDGTLPPLLACDERNQDEGEEHRSGQQHENEDAICLLHHV